MLTEGCCKSQPAVTRSPDRTAQAVQITPGLSSTCSAPSSSEVDRCRSPASWPGQCATGAPRMLSIECPACCALLLVWLRSCWVACGMLHHAKRRPLTGVDPPHGRAPRTRPELRIECVLRSFTSLTLAVRVPCTMHGLHAHANAPGPGFDEGKRGFQSYCLFRDLGFCREVSAPRSCLALSFGFPRSVLLPVPVSRWGGAHPCCDGASGTGM